MTHHTVLALVRLLAHQAATEHYLGDASQVPAGANDNTATQGTEPDARRDLRPLQQRPAAR